MPSGPSKEELEMYWKSSRQYFDELANYYKTSDPDYYNQFIAPYYSNPLYAISTKKRSGTPLITVIVSIAVLFIGLIAAGVFFLLSVEKEPEINYEPQKIEKKVDKEIEKPKIDSVKIIEPVEPKKNNNRKQRIERFR
jgi:hypothetical protein